jgi:hypothetical protein
MPTAIAVGTERPEILPAAEGLGIFASSSMFSLALSSAKPS